MLSARRWGPTCPRCKAEMQLTRPVDGNETWYCPRCGFMDFEGIGDVHV
jgi:ribosomal protein S27AE